MTTLLRGGELDTGEQVLFQQTVPRQLVHLAAVSEVLVTDMSQTGANTFLMGAQWPRAHILFAPPATRWYDPLLLVASVRQAGLAIAHAAYGVGSADKVLWDNVSFATASDGLVRGERPLDVVMTADVRDIQRNGKGIVGARIEFGCYAGDQRIGSCSTRWRRVSPATYARLRGGRQGGWRETGSLPTPVRPGLVARQTEADVLLAASARPGTWPLRVDTGNPVLFDHPVDHVPGMVIMEAARQAALLITGRPGALAVGGRFSFAHYIEFDEPCTVRAEPAVAGAVNVTFEQGGRVAAEGTLTLAC